MKTLLQAIGTAAIATILLACQTIPETNPGLDINITDLQFEKTTPFETTARVTLRLTNESPDPIAVRGAVHQLTLNRIEFGKIVSGDRLEIAPFSQSTQDVTMHISHLRVITRLKSLADTVTYNYQLKSRVHLDSPRRRVRLEKSETLDLSPPKISTSL